MDACAATTLKGYVQSGRGGKWGVNKKEGRFQFRVPKSMGVFSSSFVVTPRRTLFSLEHCETLTPRLRGQWTMDRACIRIPGLESLELGH